MAEPIRKLAVLIDADNTQPAIVGALLAEIAKYGVASVKRIYGDWTLPNLKGWKDVLAEHAIQPVQQFRYTTGKNATDGRMIIDAMDLLYTARFDGFCLVSSDSDFTGLASRLRESGMTVYGFGERKTPGSLVSACDKFIYLDVLRASVADESAAKSAPQAAATLKQDAKLVRLLREAVDAASDDEGWAGLGAVGSLISKQAPDFDARNYGFKKLSELVLATALFEVDERKSADGRQKTLYLRDRRKKN
ncbi:NYN domain-containing protein [Sinimarinibacterium thermocellulolyticum]|uniref:NYN domain-containing protein n=1 Tax=Sinimarinibacterium thermocellulolyticum TaxID=3170016 RepID=A0ABV2ADD9_9GAMM